MASVQAMWVEESALDQESEDLGSTPTSATYQLGESGGVSPSFSCLIYKEGIISNIYLLPIYVCLSVCLSIS